MDYRTRDATFGNCYGRRCGPRFVWIAEMFCGTNFKKGALVPPVDGFVDVVSGEWRVAGRHDDDAQQLPRIERQCCN